jgi:hypothetical protein
MKEWPNLIVVGFTENAANSTTSGYTQMIHACFSE